MKEKSRRKYFKVNAWKYIEFPKRPIFFFQI